MGQSFGMLLGGKEVEAYGQRRPKSLHLSSIKVLFASTAFLQHACRLEEDLEVQKNTTLVVSHITGATRE